MNIRPRVDGKFIFAGDEKLYLRGVTYGPFRPDAGGSEYHDPATVERDFAAMAAAGINAVRTYTVPPRWLLDIALRYDVRVMVGLPWEQHVTFLDDRRRTNAIAERVRAAVRSCARRARATPRARRDGTARDAADASAIAARPLRVRTRTAEQPVARGFAWPFGIALVLDSAAIRRNAVERFDTARMADEYVRVYEEVLLRESAAARFAR